MRNLILPCTEETQFILSPKLFSICSVGGTGCGNIDPVPKHCAIRPMGNAEERFHAIVTLAIVSDLNTLWVVVKLCDNCRIKTPTRCHLLFYCTSYRLNMFRAFLCPSSGARDYDVRDAGFSLQPRHYSSLTAPNLQYTANKERHNQCGNQHHRRELLMMGIVMLETCSTYKKYNKITSGI